MSTLVSTLHSDSTQSQFQYVQEWNDNFLVLFPHRYDYIWAQYPDPGDRVEWKTESRHPLSDRLIRQSAYLYGVRFGAETTYCLLDIDAGSIYHPKRDPFAISKITAALEPLGLVGHIVCTSSYSGGLHLYLPFSTPQSTWNLAIALSSLLENAGFRLLPGQLEVFPDPKPYIVDGKPSLFKAHRLPMQVGSYLLNQDFQPIWSDQQTFVQQWQLTQSRNDIGADKLKRILKIAQRKRFCISGKADKFINDLNTEIEAGWSGHGQTNRLLGRITMRTYIFHHVLAGGEPLRGQALVETIVETAKSLPGYPDWCRHQHELEQRVEEWVRCIESSHYFHYGEPPTKRKSDNEELNQAIEQAPTRNQQKSAAARDRIRGAIADLLEKSILPARATARFHALLEYGVGGGSLYRHRDLWHPSFLAVDIPPDPPELHKDSQLDCAKGAPNWRKPPSLLDTTVGDNLMDKEYSNSEMSSTRSEDSNLSSSQPHSGIQFVQQILANVRQQRQTRRKETETIQDQNRLTPETDHSVNYVTRMLQYLRSEDPILIAEAWQWASTDPHLLNQLVQDGLKLSADVSLNQFLQVELNRLIDRELSTNCSASELDTFKKMPISDPSSFHSPSIEQFRLFIRIEVQKQRLGWASARFDRELENLFGKHSQPLLTRQLTEWLDWLEKQKSSD